MMGRRGFLKAIGAGVLGLSLALRMPEKVVEVVADGLRWPHSLMRGDVFTIDGVYSLNPFTYQSTNVLQQFVVTADVNGGGLVEEEIIFPPIRAHGPFQNVTAEPEPDATVRVWMPHV